MFLLNICVFHVFFPEAMAMSIMAMLPGGAPTGCLEQAVALAIQRAAEILSRKDNLFNRDMGFPFWL